MNKLNFSKENRQADILTRLLNGEKLSYTKLSEEFLLSKSSIAKDFTQVKNLFAKENSLLVFDNSGTYFEGGEILAQRILKRAILNELAINDKYQVLKQLIEPQILKDVQKYFLKGIKEKQVEMSDTYVESITISISVLISRAKSGRKISLDSTNPVGKLFFDFDKYPIIYELILSIEESGLYQFSQEEIQFITHVIASSGLKFFMKSQVIPVEFKEEIRKFILEVSKGLQIDLSLDNRLQEDLNIHIYQLILRLQSGISVANPLLDYVKKGYPSLFGLCWIHFNQYLQDYKLFASEDEISFLTIHFQAAIERAKKKVRILFVCPNGVGTSSFISSKIRQVLPIFDSVETSSVAYLKEVNLDNFDFIISTVELKDIEIPVIQVSPMISAGDLKKVMNGYIDLVLAQKETEENGSFRDSLGFLGQRIYQKNLKTKEECIAFLLDKSHFPNEEIKKLYQKSVSERESFQSTALGKGFAIPHGDPSLLDQTQISLLLLDKPIPWGTSSVDTIFLLMIAQEDIKETEPVMSLIMQGIEKKEEFRKEVYGRSE